MSLAITQRTWLARRCWIVLAVGIAVHEFRTHVLNELMHPSLTVTIALLLVYAPTVILPITILFRLHAPIAPRGLSRAGSAWTNLMWLGVPTLLAGWAFFRTTSGAVTPLLAGFIAVSTLVELATALAALVVTLLFARSRIPAGSPLKNPNPPARNRVLDPASGLDFDLIGLLQRAAHVLGRSHRDLTELLCRVLVWVVAATILFDLLAMIEMSVMVAQGLTSTSPSGVAGLMRVLRITNGPRKLMGLGLTVAELILLIVLFIRLGVWRIGLVMFSPNSCENCGYDLSGLSTSTCPECGTTIANAPSPLCPT